MIVPHLTAIPEALAALNVVEIEVLPVRPLKSITMQDMDRPLLEMAHNDLVLELRMLMLPLLPLLKL